MTKEIIHFDEPTTQNSGSFDCRDGNKGKDIWLDCRWSTSKRNSTQSNLHIEVWLVSYYINKSQSESWEINVSGVTGGGKKTGTTPPFSGGSSSGNPTAWYKAYTADYVLTHRSDGTLPNFNIYTKWNIDLNQGYQGTVISYLSGSGTGSAASLPPLNPSTPSSCTIKDNTSGSTTELRNDNLKLFWGTSSNTTHIYYSKKKTSSSSWSSETSVASTGGGGNVSDGWAWDNVADGESFHYRIRAKNSDTGQYSGYRTSNTMKVIKVPPTPSSCTIRDDDTGSSIAHTKGGIDVSWGSSANATKYIVERGYANPFSSSYVWTKVGEYTGTSMTDTGYNNLASGTTVKYRVQAKNTTSTSGKKESNVMTTTGAMCPKVSNSWKKGTTYVNINGTWKKAKIVWVNINGTWRMA